MATIMPHGVLFRGGKEKLIRKFFINDDVIEAIISLTQDLLTGKVRVTTLLSEPQEAIA